MMTREEVVDLTVRALSLQNREAGRIDFENWEAVLGDLPAALAKDALLALARNGDTFITPMRVREEAKTLARARLAAAARPVAPSQLTPDQLRAWDNGWRNAAITGTTTPDDLETAALTAIGRTRADMPALNRQPPRLALDSGR